MQIGYYLPKTKKITRKIENTFLKLPNKQPKAGASKIWRKFKEASKIFPSHDRAGSEQSETRRYETRARIFE